MKHVTEDNHIRFVLTEEKALITLLTKIELTHPLTDWQQGVIDNFNKNFLINGYDIYKDNLDDLIKVFAQQGVELPVDTAPGIKVIKKKEVHVLGTNNYYRLKDKRYAGTWEERRDKRNAKRLEARVEAEECYSGIPNNHEPVAVPGLSDDYIKKIDDLANELNAVTKRLKVTETRVGKMSLTIADLKATINRMNEPKPEIDLSTVEIPATEPVIDEIVAQFDEKPKAEYDRVKKEADQHMATNPMKTDTQKKAEAHKKAHGVMTEEEYELKNMGKSVRMRKRFRRTYGMPDQNMATLRASVEACKANEARAADG